MKQYQVRGLREMRTNLHKRSRAIRDRAEQRGRSLTSVEAGDVAGIAKQLEPIEAFLRRVDYEGASAPDEFYATRRFAFGEYLRAWGHADGLSHEARAALAVGSPSTGGALVPSELVSEMVQANTAFGRVEALAGFFETTGGGELRIPSVVEPSGVTATLTTEGGVLAESEDTFAAFSQTVYKFATIAKASDEWFNDTGTDPVDLVTVRGGRAIAIALNTKLVNGNGTTEPQGIINNTVGVTCPTGNTTAIPADSITDLYFSVAPPYRESAVWLMHDNTLKALAKMKGTDNRPLFPGLDSPRPGEPPTIKGRPAYSDPDMPQMTANAKSVYFGDLNSNYKVRRVVPPRVQVLEQLFAGTGQIGISVARRVDGKIVDPSAARLLQNSAT